MFLLNDEQVLLGESASDFFRGKAPVSRLRQQRDAGENGRDPALWRQFAELGWLGVLVPEEYGGFDMGYLGLGLVLIEAGKHLSGGALHSSAMVGTAALVLAGTEEQKQRWLPLVASGEKVVAVAVDQGAHHRERRAVVHAKDGRITARYRSVADGHLADLFIVLGDDAMYLVEADAPGVARQELKTLDSRGAADLCFEQAVADQLTGGAAQIERLLDIARIGLAAEMIGMAQEACTITCDYLKTRRQFGQTIGSFQALQHRASKMFIEVEFTRSCVIAALSTLDDGGDVAQLASLAKAKAGDTLHLVTNEMLQMHGGIGMTDEHDAGLFMKRARILEARYGNAAFHRDRYAQLMGY